MDNKIIFIGAGGHGLVLADIAKLLGYKEVVFLDDDTNKSYKYPIIGRIEDYINYVNDYCIFISIGNNKIRKSLFECLEINGAKLVNLIHPSAIVASDVKLETGIAVMANVVINSESIIRKGCIINTLSSIDHECMIGEFVHISPGCHLAGNVTIAELCWIAIGANIINNISICANCIIGAGTTLIRGIDKPGTYVGIPLRRIE